jgi:excisionase family DNA binding protein
MTITEAAEILGLSVSATYEAAARGDIPVVRIGRRVLVKRERFLAMLDLEGPPALYGRD